MEKPATGSNKIMRASAKTWRILIVAVALLIASSSCADAQQRSVAAPTLLWQQASRSSWYVRVITTNSDTVAGRIRYRNDDIRVGGRVLPSHILSIERRTESGGGALVGALIGAIVLGAAGHGFAEMGDTGASDNLIPAAIGIGIGGLLGILAGSAVAPGKVQWKQIWPEIDH